MIYTPNFQENSDFSSTKCGARKKMSGASSGASDSETWVTVGPGGRVRWLARPRHRAGVGALAPDLPR